MTRHTASFRNHDAAPTYLDISLSWIENKGRFAYLAFAFSLGLLFSRAFAPMSIFPLVFFIIPVWLIMIDRAPSGRQIFSFGWWSGFGFFSLGLNWIGYSFTQQQAVPAFLAPFAILALAGVLSIFLQ